MFNKIIAATPKFASPSSVPHRYVLVSRLHTLDHPSGCHKKGDVFEYVVWTECFREDDPEIHTAYHEGSYFPNNKFYLAYDKWLEKANWLSEYVKSPYGKATIL